MTLSGGGIFCYHFLFVLTVKFLRLLISIYVYISLRVIAYKPSKIKGLETILHQFTPTFGVKLK